MALALVWSGAGWFAVDVANGEVFVLGHGGQVRGTWLNRDEPGFKVYHIRTESAGELKLDRGQVSQVLNRSPDEAEYDRIKTTYPDTVQGQLKIANWCLEHRLEKQRDVHLKRILALEPDHAEARQQLGFRRVSGKWMTRSEEMASRGMILHRGRYVTAQHLEIWERREKQKLAEREWAGKLNRWVRSLASDNARRSEEAEANIRAIRDSYAVPALVEQLGRSTNRPFKLLLVDTLSEVASASRKEQPGPGRVPASAASAALVRWSLEDPDPEVRHACLETLGDLKPQGAVSMYSIALKSKNNQELNRAATGLKFMGDRDAIPALIDVLVTTHKLRINRGKPGETSATFSPSGGGGFSFGGKSPKFEKRSVENRYVLEALVALSGQNFSYDAASWNSWYATQLRSPTFDARRD